jgi:GDP-4-dehydro-6-deoxy-D-mannose reductase
VRAFITGISGFAGSYLAEHLRECGDVVAGCSTSGRWRDGSPVPALRDLLLLPWDLTGEAPDELSKQLRHFRPDVVYHLAALSVPSDCGATDPTPQAWDVNVAGSQRLVDQLLRLPDSPLLLLVSSCHVYGRVTVDYPVRAEDAPLQPRTGYGKTKLAAEQVLQAERAKERLRTVIVRPFKHVGPRQGPRLMLPEWSIQLTQPADDPVRVFNLDSYFDMTDVRDVVRAYRLLAQQGTSGEVYNVGSGISLRSGDVYQRLRDLAACHRSTVELSPGIRQEPIADISRLQRTIDWRPEIPLETTLRDTLTFWRNRGC